MNNQPTEFRRWVCSICGGNFAGYGNNAWPVNPGRCCDACNNIVVTHRIRNYVRGAFPYAEPPWYKELLASTDRLITKPTHENQISVGASLPPAGEGTTGAAA